MTLSLPSSSAKRRPVRASADAWVRVIAIGIFALLSTYCAIRSAGFITGDACMHYLSARFAFSSPQNFLDVWNRPLSVMLYCIPATLGGRPAVRVTAMLLAIGCGLVAERIAARQGLRQPVLALIFTLGQPVLFEHSFGEMTELPFALLMGLAFLCFISRRWMAMAVLLSLGPLARPEGLGLLLAGGAVLAYRRKWIELRQLPWPLLIWNIAGWYWVDSSRPFWRWLWDAWPYSGTSMYGRGNAFAFFGLLPTVVSPIVLPAVLIGIGLSLRSWRIAVRQIVDLVTAPDDDRLVGSASADAIALPGERLFPKSAAPSAEADPTSQVATPMAVMFLTAATPMAVFIVHTLLFWLGRAASDGEARYLLIAAPFWGVLAGRGWEWVFERYQWRRPLAWAGASVLIVPIVVNAIRPAVPVGLSPDWRIAAALADWRRQDHRIAPDYPQVMAAHPAIFYFLDLNPYGSEAVRAFDKATLRLAPDGVTLIWDPRYSSTNSSPDRALSLEEIRKAGWIELFVRAARGDHEAAAHGAIEDETANWHVFTSPLAKRILPNNFRR